MHKIFIGSDHAGFDAKKEVKEVLESLQWHFEDLGPDELDSKDDYPLITQKVCKKVLETKDSFGILICGSGVGVAIAANKIKGIRAVQGYDEFTAKMARQDENVNILTLRSRDFDHEQYYSIIRTFLETAFSEDQRHKRRIKELES